MGEVEESGKAATETDGGGPAGGPLSRHAWAIHAVVGVIILLIGVGDFVIGAGADPEATQAIAGRSWEDLQAADPSVAALLDVHQRTAGAAIIAFSLMTIVLAATSFRRGDRSAWYALWTWPLLMGMLLAVYLGATPPSGPTPAPIYSAPVVIVLSLIGQCLPFRRFFPRAG